MEALYQKEDVCGKVWGEISSDLCLKAIYFFYTMSS